MYFNDLIIYCEFVFDFEGNFWEWNFFCSVVVFVGFVGYVEMIVIVFGFEFYFIEDFNEFF